MKFPARFIDFEKVNSNIDRMIEKSKKHNLIFRPHFKTHNNLEIARIFRAKGIDKITVSSLKMAKTFAFDGWGDILLAIPFDINQLHELEELLEISKISILVDSVHAIESIKSYFAKRAGENKIFNIDYYIKINIGNNRVGIDPSNFNEILELANCQNHHLIFKGIVAHAGQSYMVRNHQEIEKIQQESNNTMSELKSKLTQYFPDIIASVGDTPTCSIGEYFANIDEIRPGNFVFYDLMQVQISSCKIEDVSFFAYASIISINYHQHKIVLNCGAVHLSKEYIIIDNQKIFGQIVDKYSNKDEFELRYKETSLSDHSIYINSLSQEHAIVQLDPDQHYNISNFHIGDIVKIVPVHSCLANACVDLE